MTQKITIEYAREKLGEKGKRMSNEQIVNFLSSLRALCAQTIDKVAERTIAS